MFSVFKVHITPS